mgnify:CR=1 FL=1
MIYFTELQVFAFIYNSGRNSTHSHISNMFSQQPHKENISDQLGFSDESCMQLLW